MGDRTTTTTTTTLAATRPHRTSAGTLTNYLRHLHTQSPNSTQLVGILTLLVSAGLLLVLTGVTLTTFALGLILFAPIIILTTPIWLPVAALMFVAFLGFMSLCGFGVAAAAALSWVYRYYRGLHPPGSDRVDYARSRIATTAREVKDYAREYGGYLHNKVKDAAPVLNYYIYTEYI